MSIYHRRPKRHKRPKKNRCSVLGRFYVKRKRFGDLYFRRPMGDDKFTTLHIDAVGKKIVRQHGIRARMCLSYKLFKELYYK